MRPLVGLLLMLFIFGGCSVTYRHPYKSANQLETDRLECERVARRQLAAKGVT